MAPSIIESAFTRRSLLIGGAALGGATLLSGCIGGSPAATTSAGAASSGATAQLTLQSSLSDPKPKAALEAVVKGYTTNPTTLNTVAIEQFRAQLPTYLTSSTPPDVLTWYAGSVARDYASKGLLLDVSDMWSGDGACAKFSPALKSLSSDDSGKQIFVPTNYYWWSIFYRKSAFTEWGVTPPSDWAGFMALLDTLKGKGIHPLTNGTGSTAWMASGWFDYLDLRINGAVFHRELLAGKHSFDSAEVRKVMDTYATLIPYFDPKGRSYGWQEAATPLINKKAGMYLIGAFVTQAFPAADVEDVDFFSVPPSTLRSPARRRHRPTATSRAPAPRTLQQPRTCSASSPARPSSRSSSSCPNPRTCPPLPRSTARSSARWCRRASSCSRRPRRSPSSSTVTPATPCRQPQTQPSPSSSTTRATSPRS